MAAYDSISDEMCVATKALFGDIDDHTKKGGMKQMGEAMRKGMVLTMSIWDDRKSSFSIKSSKIGFGNQKNFAVGKVAEPGFLVITHIVFLLSNHKNGFGNQKLDRCI